MGGTSLPASALSAFSQMVRKQARPSTAWSATTARLSTWVKRHQKPRTNSHPASLPSGTAIRPNTLNATTARWTSRISVAATSGEIVMRQLLGASCRAPSGQAETDQHEQDHGDHKVEAEERDAAEAEQPRSAHQPRRTRPHKGPREGLKSRWVQHLMRPQMSCTPTKPSRHGCFACIPGAAKPRPKLAAGWTRALPLSTLPLRSG